MLKIRNICFQRGGGGGGLGSHSFQEFHHAFSSTFRSKEQIFRLRPFYHVADDVLVMTGGKVFSIFGDRLFSNQVLHTFLGILR